MAHVLFLSSKRVPATPGNRGSDGESMLKGITRLYIPQIQSNRKAESSELKSEVAPVKDGNSSGLVPDLQDKVEISDVARLAANQQGIDTDMLTDPKESIETIRATWYSAGFCSAYEFVESK